MLHSVMSTDHVRVVVPGGRALTLTGGQILDLWDAKKEADRKDAEGADARTGRVMEARAAIVWHAGRYREGQAASGRVACPVCKAPGETLLYARAASNGHVRARCATDGCVGWIE